MIRRLTLFLVLALGGCAGPTAAASRATVGAARSEQGPSPERARAVIARQGERIRELEAQLGLAHASGRELRDEVAALRERERSRATRIGGPRAPETDEADVVEVELEARDRVAEAEEGPRPVLRLYGSAARPAASAAGVAALPGPAAPAVLSAPPIGAARLPMMAGVDGDPAAGVPAIPAEPVMVSADPPAPSTPPSSPGVDAGAEEYRAALRHLAERRLEDALAGLDGFLRAHPRHPYADNALYWRGEIHYARRDYRGALDSFSGLIERYPRGNKVPDALLRIGLCYQRLGQADRARRVFDRLRTQYPDSVAARMTSHQEDA